ncbi:MAG: UMP kinase [Candidatus Woesearchaeota archaeon]
MAAQHNPIVISLGGSLIIPEDLDEQFLSQFKEIISRRARKGYRFAIICGGGKICRKYQSAANNISKASDTDIDQVGIAATKLNAELLRAVFGKLAYKKVLTDPRKKILTRKIIIAAGYEPGCSSDWDAVAIAKNIGASVIINLSNIEYVYDKDPNKFSDARPIPSMPWKEFFKIVGTKWTPGLNSPFDPIAAKLARKNKMKVLIVNGDLQNFESCLDGKEFKGTLIG